MSSVSLCLFVELFSILTCLQKYSRWLHHGGYIISKQEQGKKEGIYQSDFAPWVLLAGANQVRECKASSVQEAQPLPQDS